MKKLEDGTFSITLEQMSDIENFIRNSLSGQWDNYTNFHICPNVTWEDGIRRMDPEMYDLAGEMLAVMRT